jgi:hypothetical protein
MSKSKEIGEGMGWDVEATKADKA